MVPAALAVEGVTKSFGGVRALRGVDLRVERAEIHGLIGHNGAGKSTLVKVINGVHPVGTYGGTVAVDGEPVAFRTPWDARQRGVAYVPQETQVLEQLTVAENIYVGQLPTRRGLVSFREVCRRTAVLLDTLGVDLDPRVPVAGLAAAQRQLVTIARALAATPTILMLDEPTTSLSGPEADRLFTVLRRLRERAVTVVLITHRLPEVVAVCDRATVLRDGQTVASLARDELDESAIVQAMVGSPVRLVYPRRSGPIGDREVLRVSGLRIPGRAGLVRDVHLSVRAGEIVGLAGLVGSGRSEVLGAIYGRVPHEGRIAVAGRQIRLRRPADARRAGIALLTEDRRREGLLFNFTALENMTIGNLTELSRAGFVDRAAERQRGRSIVDSLGIRTPSLRADVDHLSGGTQQKLLLGRVLMREPTLLLLDEPTKGVDVKTKHEIYRLVIGFAERGIGVVLVSSELDELLGLCDRCVVLAGGRIVDEFDRGEGSEARIIQATADAHRRDRTGDDT